MDDECRLPGLDRLVPAGTNKRAIRTMPARRCEHAAGDEDDGRKAIFEERARGANGRAVDECEIHPWPMAGAFRCKPRLPILFILGFAERGRGDAARERELGRVCDTPCLDAVDRWRLLRQQHRREMRLLTGQVTGDEPMGAEPVDEIDGRRRAADAPYRLAVSAAQDLLAHLVDRLGHLRRVEARAQAKRRRPGEVPKSRQ
jgi:hypothetical protein